MTIYLQSQYSFLEATANNLRLQKIITGIGILLFLMKTIAWYITNSVAILTDALESTVNVVAGLLGIYSLYVSAKPKDTDHPYGHGKVEFISSAVEGTLISVAGILIVYNAVINLFNRHEVEKLDYGIILVAITAIINYIAGAICIKTGNKNNSLVLVAGGKHLQTDTYSTVGIIVGLGLLYFLKIWWIDSAVAIIFALIILYTGYKIIRTSISGIMDEADINLISKMVDMLNRNRRTNWIDIHNLRFIKNGATLHLDCHLTVPWYLNVNEAHLEIDALSALVKQEFGESMELFVHSDGCLETSCPICDKGDCPVRQHAFEKKIKWTVNNIVANDKHRISTSED